ncbi:hypothetical protein EUGRSUZ_F04409 [Eucalyptus grandis]|uniref:Uncharacterized protein n=2 Tax=Eucalyptus grandis TaxID=71139 RepID=A0A059BYY1_EUCGR|nr:hypothetical protein EUGRSUZ_F04409 [Eucalyptus grandis]
MDMIKLLEVRPKSRPASRVMISLDWDIAALVRTNHIPYRRLFVNPIITKKSTGEKKKLKMVFSQILQHQT